MSDYRVADLETDTVASNTEKAGLSRHEHGAPVGHSGSTNTIHEHRNE
jgi:hypothetical protein